MFKLIFQGTYDEYVYMKYNIKPIVEDCYKVHENVFCVADGVTMDLKTGEFTPYPNSKEQAEYIINNYPNPSGSFMAAQICCTKFIQYLKGFINKKVDKDIIKSIVDNVNNDIWEINKDRKIDYSPNDLYCCEAVGGIIQDNTLFCFSIGDSDITLFDEEYNMIFNTNDNVDEIFDYIDNIIYKNNKLDWASTIRRQTTRRDFRNNINSIYDGKVISYGALTGEKTAMNFVDVYEVNLDKVKYICAYTDGYKPFLKDKESIKNIIEDPSSVKEKGKEKTLVIYERI